MATSTVTKREIAIYDYQDRFGVLLYQVVRYEPKSFAQRRPTDDGYRWRLNGVPRVPYRLPELLGSSPATIYISEGEKDADALRAIGLTATTNAGGCGAGWSQELTPHFANRDVVILPDNDGPGLERAEKIAAALHGTAKSVRVVWLAGLPDHGDVSDWIAMGGSREKLEALAAETPLAEPAIIPEDDRPTEIKQVTTTLELQTASSVPQKIIRWLWPNRIPAEKLSVFCGPPDVGKSTMSTDIVARLTTGREWPDCENVNGPADVLMLISEDDLADTVCPRLNAAGADLHRVHFAVRVEIRDGERTEQRRIALDTDLAAIEAALERKPAIKLVIVDPLGSYLGRAKKNDEEAIRNMLVMLKELAERRGVAVLSLDHFNKNYQQAAIHRLSGAGALAAVPRAVWAFVKDGDDSSIRHMLNVKLNVCDEHKKHGLKYRFDQKEVAIKGVTTSLPVIQWMGASTGDIDDTLQAQADPKENRSARARRFLQKYLATGAQTSEAIYSAASDQKISRSALWTVKDELKIQVFKSGSQWWWELPAGGESNA